MKRIRRVAPPVVANVEDIVTGLRERIAGQSIERILLVQPLQVPADRLDLDTARQRRYYAYPAYGIGVLSTHLKKRGYTVRLIDLNYLILERLQRPGAAQETTESIDACWREQLEAELAAFKPQVVGLSCMYTMSQDVTIETAELVRSRAPDALVVGGGVHFSNDAEQILRQAPSIDVICQYEADVSFCNLIDVINGRKDNAELSQLVTRTATGTATIDRRHILVGDEMDVMPDYDDLPIGNFSNVGDIGIFRFWRAPERRSGSLLSNRGCRARCSFCSVRNFHGDGVSGRTLESVIAEIEYSIERYGITHFTWLDDDLFFDEDRTIKLFNEMVRRNLNITWDASNGVIASASVAHPEIIDAAAASGCIALCFGVESGNSETLARIHKPSGIKHFLRIGEMMQSYPQIFTKGFLMMGFPHETLGQIMDTVRLAHDMKLDWYSLQVLTPLPSTEVYQSMVADGLIAQGSLHVGVRESDRQRLLEQSQGRCFTLDSRPSSYVPTAAELFDLWLEVDYQANYVHIPFETHVGRLQKKRAFLMDVAGRRTQDNPIVHRFLGMVLTSLGEHALGAEHQRISERALARSPYWQMRFDSLGLTAGEETALAPRRMGNARGAV